MNYRRAFSPFGSVRIGATPYRAYSSSICMSDDRAAAVVRCLRSLLRSSAFIGAVSSSSESASSTLREREG